MPVSDEYLDYVADQLTALGAVQAKKMFGGAGIYLDGVIFGIVAGDVLYFRVDDRNRADYEDCGMGPFRPYPGRSVAMAHYEVPADVLEDRETLCAWADKALAAARRAANKRKKSRGARRRR